MFKEYCSFDLALALYHWLQHNWEGQTDPLYSAHCELTNHYRPSRSEEYSGIFKKDGYEMAKEVYDSLTVDNYTEALYIVLNFESEGN